MYGYSWRQSHHYHLFLIFITKNLNRKTPPALIASQLNVFKQTLSKRKKYVKTKHQAYGLQLAEELGDWKNRSLYIRLAKNEDPKILEKARLFIKDQNPGSIKTPYKLFMWKLKQIRLEKNKKS